MGLRKEMRISGNDLSNKSSWSKLFVCTNFQGNIYGSEYLLQISPFIWFASPAHIFYYKVHMYLFWKRQGYIRKFTITVYLYHPTVQPIHDIQLVFQINPSHAKVVTINNDGPQIINLQICFCIIPIFSMWYSQWH